jgi:hypothetical protein
MRRSRSGIVALVGALLVAAGCAAGGSTSTTAGPQASGASPASAPQATSQPGSSAAAPSQPAAAGGGLPADPCQLVTVEDVKAIYGGNVKALGLDENGSCPFEIEGQAKAGKSAAAGEFAVSFGDAFSSYETAKTLFGDSVVKIDGLGTEAYSVGGFIHAKVGAGALVVGGVWVGDYDRAKLDQETIDMTKLLLGRV